MNSGAKLVVAGSENRVLRAAASAPQRWVLAGRAADGWLETVHQFIGDGVFGGDTHRTTIRVRDGARLAVRSLSATPLRGDGFSACATRISVGPGTALIALPGALVPHRGSAHATSVRVRVEPGARALLFSLLAPGRTAMGEYAAFESLRNRVSVVAGGQLAFHEDVYIDPREAPLDSLAAFAGGGAVVSALAIGAWPPSLFDSARDAPGVLGGAAPLRMGGSCYRAVARTLGEAQQLIAAIEHAARRVPDQPECDTFINTSPETISSAAANRPAVIGSPR